jgi:hypothetical protein
MIKISSAVLLAVLSAYPAFAQYSNPRASVFVAGSFPGGNRVFEVDPGEVIETDLRKGAKIGFRIGADLTETWGAEATYSFGSADLRVRETTPTREREFDAHLHQFMVNGLYNFLPSDSVWRPFATVGLGLARYSPKESARDAALQNFLDGPTRISSSTRLSINFGGGVEREITEIIGVRADVRDHIIGIPRFGLPEVPLNPNGVFYPVKGVVHDFEISVGVVFHFWN